MVLRRSLHIILLALLAACTPQATPFPVDIPAAATSTPEQSASAPIRYALAANTRGFVADLALIQTSAQVEQLTDPVNPADVGVQYDIVATYGDLPGGTRSPIMPHAALAVKTNGTPLNNPILFNALLHSIHPANLVEIMNIPGMAADTIESEESQSIRTELANAGWPDGFTLNMAYDYIPGISALAQQFQAAGIKVQTDLMSPEDIKAAFDQNRIQVALVQWRTAEEQTRWSGLFPANHLINLYSIPISYYTAAGLRVTFTPGGWPLASR